MKIQAGKYPWIMAVNFGSTDGSSPGGCTTILFFRLHCFTFLLLLGCAATLVASNWAITAAHCVVDSGFTTKDDLSLVLGEFDISTSADSNDGNRLKI